MILDTSIFKNIGETHRFCHVISILEGEIEFLVTKISETEYNFNTDMTPSQIQEIKRQCLFNK